MPTLTDYKGLDIVEGATGAAGIALTDDFKKLADRAAMRSSGDPTVDDDETLGYDVGSQWYSESSQTIWVCLDKTATAAVWKPLTTRTDSGFAVGADSDAMSSGDMVNGQINFWIDEVSSPKKLMFNVKLSNGDVKVGEVNLA